MQTVKIPLSKTKIFFLVLGSLGFIGFGIWIYLNPHPESEYGPLVYQYAGLVMVVVFGMIGLRWSLQLFSNKPGLEINDKGLMDNCSNLRIGLICWEDIEGVSLDTVKIHDTKRKILLLQVNNMSDLLKQKNLLARILLRLNHPLGTNKVRIDSVNLKINFEELHDLIETTWGETKKVI